MKNVLEYLEHSAEEFQDKIAVDDGTTVYTYRQLHELARRIGSAIAGHTKPGTPVPVVMDKSAETLAIYLGIVEAGCLCSGKSGAAGCTYWADFKYARCAVPCDGSGTYGSYQCNWL